ncbi:MAG: hypothetical protein AABX14_02380 [Candidatus Aenigmatarchaeota archaeon]
MKVYIVGHHGPEHNMITSVHKTRKGAIKKWNDLRLYLLRNAKRNQKKGKPDDMWHEMVKNLSCKDPDKIDNYPHETPYIEERTVNE